MLVDITLLLERKKVYGRSQAKIIKGSQNIKIFILGMMFKSMKLENTSIIREEEHESLYMIINKQEEEIIIIKVKKMEDGLNQVKTFKTQVLLFIKANILMVRNMVSGIFCIKGMQISHLNQSFGFYDQQNNFIDSIKIGRWIEPDDGFWNLSQVINIGEYKYGKKVGLWDIKYRISDNQSFQIIGGGYYKQLEDNSVLGSFKNGQWIELTDGFWRDKQVTYYGEYLNGYKVGKWDIYYNNQETEQNEYMEIEQIECTIWDSLNYKFKKITILIKFNEEKEVSYIQNGQIIRIEQVKDQLQMSEILINLEQIKYFQWCGNYGQNSQKVDRWTGSWNQITLEDVGGYYSIVGKKEGLWKELSQNYQGNDVQIYEVGKYINNQRRGT
ncbi:unnamed protein product [Paramecium sonneborni]|uniref:Uncharacterized protein n=1 Tax=Paramecium sonneborni TaxID=65129 RepID=A0A8S1KUB3_9CILI|nr:unnamed protein product [Paramecium sonneborni]